MKPSGSRIILLTIILILLSSESYSQCYKSVSDPIVTFGERRRAMSNSLWEYRIKGADWEDGVVVLTPTGEVLWNIKERNNIAKDDYILKQIELEVRRKSLFNLFGLRQTPLIYKFFFTGSSIEFINETGLVCNSKNVWMHPPRSGLFRMLELAPFPYIRFVEMESGWSDVCYIGDHWSDSRWANWEGIMKLELEYHSVADTTILSSFGPILVKKIESTSKSKVGTSNLVAYYSYSFGFVRLEYNILDKYEIDFWIKSN